MQVNSVHILKKNNNCKNLTLRLVYSARDVEDAVPYRLHNSKIFFKDKDNSVQIMKKD